ncbi:hypothetical protein [Sphingomonas sp.]|uniref:hypothetical protein n=1 Tax=Sphingomonas sp. TaxID=28214 RepID=UPI003B3BAD6A
MVVNYPSRLSPQRDKAEQPQLVRAPAPSDGIQRALRGSFAAMSTLPEDIARLLGRIR